jgi:hypothetical protein
LSGFGSSALGSLGGGTLGLFLRAHGCLLGGALGGFGGSALRFFLDTAHLLLSGTTGLFFGLALCHLLLLAHLLLGSAAGLLLRLLAGHFLRTTFGFFLSATHLGLSLTTGLLLRLTLRHFLGAASGFFLLTLHRGGLGLLCGPIFGHGALLRGKLLLLALLHGSRFGLLANAFGLSSGQGLISRRFFRHGTLLGGKLLLLTLLHGSRFGLLAGAFSLGGDLRLFGRHFLRRCFLLGGEFLLLALLHGGSVGLHACFFGFCLRSLHHSHFFGGGRLLGGCFVLLRNWRFRHSGSGGHGLHHGWLGGGNFDGNNRNGLDGGRCGFNDDGWSWNHRFRRHHHGGWRRFFWLCRCDHGRSRWGCGGWLIRNCWCGGLLGYDAGLCGCDGCRRLGHRLVLNRHGRTHRFRRG